jgi:hypothetical protein
LSFSANDDTDEDLHDEEDEIREEYADAEEEYADDSDSSKEPTLREPVLSFADDEPRFSSSEPRFSSTETHGDRTEPSFSLHADTDAAEPRFSALDDDEAPEPADDYRAVRSRYATPARDDDKRQVRRYLDDIEDEDALDELAPNTLDYLDDEPVHIAPPRAPRRFFTWLLFALGSLLLLGVLALQFITAHLDQLSQSARFALLRPYLCQVVTCPLPSQAPSTLVSEQLVVRAHPSARDSLEVTAVLHNKGAATQPLPGVEMIFRDRQDQIVASRVFTPQEYLPVELRTAAVLPSQSTVQMRLEMANPGPEALNYELVLHPLSATSKR